ncbi:hypothetical protein [Roseibium sp. Sym1]|uniref:hypothetical protein n=1 Tax=Roseibium sp. Sym1 TaxID=3016006 RepID=UPI0022B5B2AC|nr:hypothetical protein [Roseibium sp. Sym1]
MAESFVARWEKNIKLTVYAEDFEPDVEGVTVAALPDWLTEFKRKYGPVPDASGMASGTYNYRRDCIRFAHKVAAVCDFVGRFDDGVAIWSDADMFTHADVTSGWLSKFFDRSAAMAWLFRKRSYPECGFMMFRCSHPGAHEFLKRLEKCYRAGNVFDYPETHDSYVIQQIVKRVVDKGLMPQPVSLSGGAEYTAHPIANGPIGQRLDHLKGKRKDTGISWARDLKVKRPEKYWNGAA